jgi:hypothetical protein
LKGALKIEVSDAEIKKKRKKKGEKKFEKNHVSKNYITP